MSVQRDTNASNPPSEIIGVLSRPTTAISDALTSGSSRYLPIMAQRQSLRTMLKRPAPTQQRRKAQHWSLMMSDLKNMRQHQSAEDMAAFHRELKASKLSAMKSKRRLVAAVKRLILKCAVQRMKLRLEKYNVTQQSRKTLLSTQFDTVKRRLGASKMARQSFHDFWKGLAVPSSIFSGFEDLEKHDILEKWIKQYHAASAVWSLFDDVELQDLFGARSSMSYEVRIWNFGTTIFKKGDEGRYFYTILDGDVSLWIPSKGTNIGSTRDRGGTGGSTMASTVSAATKNKQDGVPKRAPRASTVKTKWERIKTLTCPVAFGELALFPGGDGLRNATCVARSQCLVLLIDRANYLTHIHAKIMRSRNETAGCYTHLKRNSSKANLERLTIIASIAIAETLEPLHVVIPDKVHSFHKMELDAESIYMIQSGCVGICLSSERRCDLTLKRGRAITWSSQTPFFELGAGSIIDIRVLHAVGMRRFQHKSRKNRVLFARLTADETAIANRIYYIAKTKVTLQKFKLNTFVEVGKFDLFALCRVARMELGLVFDRYNEHRHKLERQREWKRMVKQRKRVSMREKRANDPGILGSGLHDKEPLELYKINTNRLSRFRIPTQINFAAEQEAQEEADFAQLGGLGDVVNAVRRMSILPRASLGHSEPLPEPLKIIHVPRDELPPEFL